MDHPVTYWIGNSVALGAIVSTIIGIIPAVAALLALIWYVIQIYESETTKLWLAKRKARKIIRLKIALAKLEIKSNQPN